jgi:thiamine biosynthesis lipoprotein
VRAPSAPAALLVALLGAGSASPASIERQVAMMGTTLTVTVEADDRAAALAASETAVRALAASERRLSTWTADSELARLNRAPAGTAVDLSAELAAELAAARRCHAATGGAFDPGIGALVEAWGLRRGGRLPAPAELEAARAASGFAALSLDGTPGEERAVRLREGLVVEEGAFGKGAGLDAALAALRREGRARRALLDLGGQVAVYGAGAWSVRLADPRARQQPVLEWTVESGSLSTSGNGERGLVVAGERLGHLLDPRTGRPARDFGSLTVWAADGLSADCLSTGLFVLGPEAALAWALAHPPVEAVALEPRPGGLRARATPGLRGHLRPLADGLELEFVKPPVAVAAGTR